MILQQTKKTDRLNALRQMHSEGVLTWKIACNIRGQEWQRGKKRRSQKVIKWVNTHKKELLCASTA